MAGWTTHRGLAVGLPFEGIDTDQLIPARFMSTPRSAGYGNFLLHDRRRSEDGTLDPGFPLNQQAASGASIIVARRNFGGGSSREAAVYALRDAGFVAVLAPSFGEIFAANAVNNGLLPALVSVDAAESLLAMCPHEITIDLEQCCAFAGGQRFPFDVDPVWLTKIRNGWDDIDLTLSYQRQIAEFAQSRRLAEPWIFDV
jgi:3-isopropylmalate dehydratase, small subunit